MNTQKQIDPEFVARVISIGKLFLGFFTVFGVSSFAFFNLMNEVDGKFALQQAVYSFSILFAWLFLLGSLLFWVLVAVGIIDRALRVFELSEFKLRNVSVPVRLLLQVAVILCVVVFGWSYLGDARPVDDFLDAFLALDPANIKDQ